MQIYVKKNKRPSVGNAGRTDELYVEINGDMNYMYALMDDEARFWIVQQFSDKSSRLI
jgi:transposase-like protein